MTDSTEPFFPKYLSPSSMGTFNQCPLKYKYNKIDGLVDPPTEATLLGNFVHEILENFYTLEPLERTKNAVKSFAASVWHDGNWEERVTPYVHRSNMRQFRWNAWWCLENLWKIENPHDIDTHSIEFELNGGIGKATVKGFVDRFDNDGDGVLKISDYKTGKTPSANWVDGKFLQLKIYAVVAKEIGVGEVNTLQLLYLKDGKKFIHHLVEKDIEETVNYIESTHQAVIDSCTTGEFPYKKSKLCNWCSYKSICPGWKK